MLCGKPGNDNGLPPADGKVGRSPHTGKPMRTLNCDEYGNTVHIVHRIREEEGADGMGVLEERLPKKENS